MDEQLDWQEDQPIKSPSKERDTFAWDNADVYI